MKKIMLSTVLVVLLVSCEKKYFDDVPLLFYLQGVWKLEKITSPNQNISASQLGYEQLLEMKEDGNRNKFYTIYRDKKSVLSKPTVESIISEKQSKQKFSCTWQLDFKNYIWMEYDNSQSTGSKPNPILITSDLIDNTRKTPVDTIRYYYSYYGKEKDW
ncbi:hypothetical protein [Emticicia sp. BO119]|uniref:hypothetical protein n=1 Tax=Emticicia sp. BO119 TaxID=2757768 RepID=UPI0015F02672|nr:hypothetical protein [Emticicia sp. BO119]MBA4849379.1 hypothetical protein [Emticicia sp. BO119]